MNDIAQEFKQWWSDMSEDEKRQAFDQASRKSGDLARAFVRHLKENWEKGNNPTTIQLTYLRRLHDS